MEPAKRSQSELNEDTEDKYRIYASMAFMTVVIIIGIPMWWKTTEVYRVSLPYSGIKDINSSSLIVSLNVGIYTADQSQSLALKDEFEAYFQRSSIWNISFIQILPTEKTGSAKTPAMLETTILKSFDILPGDFLFIEWQKLTDEILLTSDRSALFSNSTSASKMLYILDNFILQSYKIQSIISDNTKNKLQLSVSQPQYDVLISVFNPRPDLQTFDWDLRAASEAYLTPFLESINLVSNFTLKTQWKYQAAFEIPLRQVRDESKIGRHYALSAEKMPHFITTIEKHIGGGISDNTTIQIVVYIPPCDISPLYIYDADVFQPKFENISSFVSLKWGTVVIYNPPIESCLEFSETQNQISFTVNSNEIMQVILYHLQKLLDINVEVPIDGVKFVEAEQLAPRVWEYESYIRRSIIMNVITATRTLQSLIALLDNINYIVINDDVGDAVNDAYRAILNARENVRNGDIITGSLSAKKAFISSEKAFFDSSLLAQLYFPEEQKYAIYIPLFLPIMVPVITSLATIKKYFVLIRRKPETL